MATTLKLKANSRGRDLTGSPTRNSSDAHVATGCGAVGTRNTPSAQEALSNSSGVARSPSSRHGSSLRGPPSLLPHSTRGAARPALAGPARRLLHPPPFSQSPSSASGPTPVPPGPPPGHSVRAFSGHSSFPPENRRWAFLRPCHPPRCLMPEGTQ